MPTAQEDRAYWVALLARIARPVLAALSERRLKTSMPVEVGPGEDAEARRRDRAKVTHLEALGRLLTGVAPWLELNARGQADDTPEGKLRAELADLARKAIDAGTDPRSPDYMNFTT